ncbi:MAG: endonuclease/exonuclease/phosphatase family protein [Dehalococcoidia bacterium]|nr:endonuclease/exonuclease/phosphatase family protein [Dehalococcoidia bacterium]
MPEFTVVSLNLRGIHDSWLRREPLVVHGLAEIHPDIICLQEAATWCLRPAGSAGAFPGDRLPATTPSRPASAGWRGYPRRCRHPQPPPARGAPCPRPRCRRTRRPACRRPVEGCPLVVGNAHLDHHSSSGDARQRQAQALVRWLENARVPALLAGDLNDVPGSPALQTFAGPFRSAHEGVELVGTAPAWDRHRVIDYILVGEGCRSHRRRTQSRCANRRALAVGPHRPLGPPPDVAARSMSPGGQSGHPVTKPAARSSPTPAGGSGAAPSPGGSAARQPAPRAGSLAGGGTGRLPVASAGCPASPSASPAAGRVRGAGG